MYNLEEQESQDHIAINLMPLLAKEMQHKGEQPSQTRKTHRWVILLDLPRLISSPFWPPAYCWDRRVSPLCLSPFFRLLRLCEEKQHNGDLEEIDGLVGEWCREFVLLVIYLTLWIFSACAFPGCPLILTDMDVTEKIDSLSKAERDFICTLLFHTINWFREVIVDASRQALLIKPF